MEASMDKRMDMSAGEKSIDLVRKDCGAFRVDRRPAAGAQRPLSGAGCRVV
jgi:hypothetical protein